jgi:hypothetical protein
MSLANLAAFAVSNNFSTASTKTRLFELSIEEARGKVVVKDGNRKPNEDGSQALTLNIGKYVLGLDVIAKGATRVNATKDQVADFSAQLLAAVKEGAFDSEIVAAQAKAKATAEAPPKAAKVVVEGEETTGEDVQSDKPETVDVDGLDLSTL